MKKCPNPDCGAINDDRNRFCQRCGHQLPQTENTKQGIQTAVRDPFESAILTGAGAGVIGGALSVLGWFAPWISFGDLLSRLIRTIVDGGNIGGFIGLSGGIGNGLQITLGMLLLSFAALSDSDSVGIGLLGLTIVIFMVAIIVFAVLNVQNGIKLFELRLSKRTESANQNIKPYLQGIRSRSGGILTVLVIIFIILTAIPFGTAALGQGFYITSLGFLVSYLGTRFGQYRLRQVE